MNLFRGALWYGFCGREGDLPLFGISGIIAYYSVLLPGNLAANIQNGGGRMAIALATAGGKLVGTGDGRLGVSGWSSSGTAGSVVVTRAAAIGELP